MPEKKLTLKELVVFSMAYYNKLDENGFIADTKMNKLRYKLSCMLAGGADKLDDFCGSIMKKLGVDIPEKEG